MFYRAARRSLLEPEEAFVTPLQGSILGFMQDLYDGATEESLRSDFLSLSRSLSLGVLTMPQAAYTLLVARSCITCRERRPSNAYQYRPPRHVTKHCLKSKGSSRMTIAHAVSSSSKTRPFS